MDKSFELFKRCVTGDYDVSADDLLRVNIAPTSKIPCPKCNSVGTLIPVHNSRFNWRMCSCCKSNVSWKKFLESWFSVSGVLLPEVRAHVRGQHEFREPLGMEALNFGNNDRY